MKRTIYLLTIFTCISCNPIRMFRPSYMDFTFRDHKPYPRIDTILNTDGYFLHIEKPDSIFIQGRKPLYSQHSVYAKMFYRDGSIASYSGPAGVQLHELFTDTSQRKKGLILWGRYYLCGDTIKSQIVQMLGWRDTHVYEQHFFIENKNTIKLIRVINHRQIADLKKEYLFQVPKGMEYDKDSEIRNTILHFVPFPERIDSAHWVKKKKWFWR